MIGYKLLAIVFIISVAMGGAWTARHLSGSAAGARRAASANAMAGGFLLGAGLFHFLPGSHHLFETLYPDHVIPYGFALCALGFTAVLAIERLAVDPNVHENASGATGKAPILAITLSVHAVFTGFAIGSEDAPLAFLSLILALGIHKFAAAFTLGSSLLRSGVSGPAFYRTVGAFAVSTPIGLVLGTVAGWMMEDDTGEFVEATFDALAAGTFLYIAALDVVHDEFYRKRATWTDMGLFAGGLVLMLILTPFA